MKYRRLGRTTVDVGIIGLGAEHLENAPRNTVVSVVNEAMENGVNYIDLFLASPNVRDNFGIALENRRQKIIMAGHLGPALKRGQYFRTRDNRLSEKYFEDLLRRLQTDYIDVLMLHWVDESNDYKKVFGQNGLLKLALRLRKEGKTRFIGLSSHRVPVALKAVNSGYIDVLMFSINPVFDILPADMEVETQLLCNSYKEISVSSSESTTQRKDLYYACALQGIGLIAMKPYAAGRLLTKDNPSRIVLTPVQCLNYALSQPAVSTAVPGCKNVDEMKAALALLNATDEEKSYDSIDANAIWKLKGSCVYCNHCLPCPVGINIGATIRIIDTAGYGVNENIISDYEMLSSKASDCTECGACVKRCPFGVDIIATMNQAVDIFGK